MYSLDEAFTNFFDKRAEYPRFKKRGQADSFHFPQGIKVDQGNSRVFLPKLGLDPLQQQPGCCWHSPKHHRQRS
jgi:hypothetical protein